MTSTVHFSNSVSANRFIFTRIGLLGWVAVLSWACGISVPESLPTEATPTAEPIEIEFQQACKTHFDLPPPFPSFRHVVIGRHGWLLLRSELRYIFGAPSRFSEPPVWGEALPTGAVDPLTAILFFNRDLQEMGITLIVVPVPVRPLVYPESVLDSSSLTDLPRQPYLAQKQKRFLEHLESNDCAAIDLTPPFIEYRTSVRGPIFIPTESHWTGFGVFVAGREIAKAVKHLDWYGSIEKISIQEEWLTVDYLGDLSQGIQTAMEGVSPSIPLMQDVALEPIEMDIRKVTSTEDGRPARIERRNPESPVVIIGDSYTDFGSAGGFGIGHQLAFELGFPLDVMTTKGGGANAARMDLVRAAASDPSYLTGKKCVIWCFASRDIVGEQWFVTPFRR